MASKMVKGVTICIVNLRLQCHKKAFMLNVEFVDESYCVSCMTGDCQVVHRHCALIHIICSHKSH